MNTVVPYDHLIIATGTQYQVPAPTEADISQLTTSNEVSIVKVVKQQNMECSYKMGQRAPVRIECRRLKYWYSFDFIYSFEVPNSPDRRFKGIPPKNVFTINDSYDTAVALYWIDNNLLNTEGMHFIHVFLFIYQVCL